MSRTVFTARERLWANLTIPIYQDLVNFDRFGQHASIPDAHEIYNMAAVRDLSTSNTVFKSVIICYKQQANRFLQVKCLREEQKHCIAIWSMKRFFCNPSHRFKEFNLSTLSTSNVSYEWRSLHRLHDHGGLSSSRGHNERPS